MSLETKLRTAAIEPTGDDSISDVGNFQPKGTAAAAAAGTAVGGLAGGAAGGRTAGNWPPCSISPGGQQEP